MADANPPSFRRLGKEFETLRSEYRAAMPAKIERLGSLWSRLAAGEAGMQAVSELLVELHRIAGSAGTFGLPQLGEVAASAEAYLAGCTADGRRLGPEEERHFNRLLGELRNASLPPRPRR